MKEKLSSIERKLADDANLGTDVGNSTVELLQKPTEHLTNEPGTRRFSFLDRLTWNHDDGVIRHHLFDVIRATGILRRFDPANDVFNRMNICQSIAVHRDS